MGRPAVDGDIMKDRDQMAKDAGKPSRFIEQGDIKKPSGAEGNADLIELPNSNRNNGEEPYLKPNSNRWKRDPEMVLKPEPGSSSLNLEPRDMIIKQWKEQGGEEALKALKNAGPREWR